MSTFILIFAYSILGIFIISIECFRKRNIPYDGFFLFNACYFLYFVIAPLHVIIGGEYFVRQTWIYEKIGPGGLGEALWILVSYILIVFGYFMTPSLKTSFGSKPFPRVVWALVVTSLFFIGSIAFIYYVKAAGGFLFSIQEAVFIRQGIVKINADYIFLKHLIPAWTAAALLLVAISWNNRNYFGARFIKGRFLRVIFIIAVTVLMFLPGLILGGRRALAFPIVVLFFLWGNLEKRWHFKSAVLLFFIGFVFLAFWDALSFGFRDFAFNQYLKERAGSLLSIYANAFRPVADAYMHWVGMHANEPILWAFKDVVFLPFYLIPSRLVSWFDVTSVAEITTEMLKGISLGKTAAEPPGFHGYLYMSGGIFGLIVGSVFFGMLLKIAHCVFSPKLKTATGWLVYLWVVIGLVYLLRHGMIEFVLNERFHWWLALFLTIFWGVIIMSIQSIRKNTLSPVRLK